MSEHASTAITATVDEAIIGRPKRIQLRRTKGWRKPEGAVVVARPSRWGNPFRVLTNTPAGRAEAADAFRRTLTDVIETPFDLPAPIEIRIIAESIDELAGKDLACWCPLDQPCHADVLLALANDGGQS